MKRRKKISIGQWVLTLILGAYALVCFLPVVLVFVASFTSDTYIQKNGFTFFPKEWSLNAWKYVAGYGEQLLVSYGVTIFVTVAGTLVSLVVMSMFAYSLSRSCFDLRKYLAIFMLITMLFSGGRLSSYIIETSVYGLRDSLLALIFPGISAMNIIIMRTYIQTNISDSLVESAKIDGAGEFRIFWQIVFPMMKPTIASVGFMQAVTYWNDWQKAFMYISSANKTPLQLLLIRIEKNVTFLLENQSSIPASEYAELMNTLPQESGRMAILLTAIGPIAIAYPFFQKYFVKGLTVGAVKG